MLNMDSLKTVLQMKKLAGCFMASIDLKDAYYSVLIATADQKYLKFQWQGKLYKYLCFTNGLAFCSRKFTKLLKPVYSHLRQLGTFQQVILMTHISRVMTVKEMLEILSNYLIPLDLLYTLKNHLLFHNIRSASWVLL